MRPKATSGSGAEPLGSSHLKGTGANPQPEQRQAPAQTMDTIYGGTQQSPTSAGDW